MVGASLFSRNRCGGVEISPQAPEPKVYHITEAGRAALLSWSCSPPAPKELPVVSDSGVPRPTLSTYPSQTSLLEPECLFYITSGTNDLSLSIRMFRRS